MKDYEIANYLLATVISAQVMSLCTWVVEMDDYWISSLMIAIPVLTFALLGQVVIGLSPDILLPYSSVIAIIFTIAIFLYYFFFPNRWVRTKGFFQAILASFIYLILITICVGMGQGIFVAIGCFFLVYILRPRYD